MYFLKFSKSFCVGLCTFSFNVSPGGNFRIIFVGLGLFFVNLQFGKTGIGRKFIRLCIYTEIVNNYGKRY